MKRASIFLIFILLLSFSIRGQVPPIASSITPPGLKKGNFNSPGSFKKIPYKKALKEIQALKQSYDSLNQEFKSLRSVKIDSTRKDSIVNVLKKRGQQVLRQQEEMLQNFLSSSGSSSPKLENTASYLLKQLEQSKETIKMVDDIPELEAIIQQNEENLKALTNEWLMPDIEQKLAGNINSNSVSEEANPLDYYGKDALKELNRENIGSQLTMNQARSISKEKTLDISNEYLQNIGNNYSKISLDSLGNIKVTEPNPKERKFSLKEPNTLKKAKVLDRMGFYLWYDPLTSFGEGVYGDFGIKYSISSQWHSFAGVIVRRTFKNQLGPTSIGEGIKGGLRYSLGNWFVLGELARSRVNVNFAPGFESKNFEGAVWSTGLGGGRFIPLGKKLRSVVLLTWDPLFKENRSLSSSRFQLKIGFELNQLKKVTQEIPGKLIPSNLRPNATSKILD